MTEPRLRTYQGPEQPDQKWREFALCQETDPDLFFPEPDAGQGQIRAALEVCGDCLVRQQCLAYALDQHEWVGIWGGTTPNQRRGIVRQLRLGKR